MTNELKTNGNKSYLNVRYTKGCKRENEFVETRLKT